MNKLLVALLLVISPCISGEDAAMHPYLAQAAKSLVGADGKKVDQQRLLKPKHILVYFSAHWCPPCRAFTPELVKFYKGKGGGTDFEILFVSSDEDAQKMLGYMKEAAMPWIGLRFGSSKTGELRKKFGGDGIPCLTLIDQADQVIFHSYVDGKYVGPQRVLQQFEELLKKK